MCLQYKSFVNTEGKPGEGEIACHKQFLFFSSVFSIRLENFLPFSSNFKLLSASTFCMEESKLSFGKGLKHFSNRRIILCSPRQIWPSFNWKKSYDTKKRRWNRRSGKDWRFWVNYTRKIRSSVTLCVWHHITFPPEPRPLVNNWRNWKSISVLCQRRRFGFCLLLFFTNYFT